MPPRKPKPKPKPKAKTTKRRVYLTLSDECRKQLDAFRARRPELQSISLAVEWAARVASERGGES